jgi:hypothetical protein
LRQFASRPAHDRLCLGAVAEMSSGPTRLTHSTGPSRKLSNIASRHLTMVLPNSHWNVWQCGRSDTLFKPHCFIPADVGNQDSALKTLQGLRPEPRAPLIKGYVISIETQVVNMGIRKRSI